MKKILNLLALLFGFNNLSIASDFASSEEYLQLKNLDYTSINSGNINFKNEESGDRSILSIDGKNYKIDQTGAYEFNELVNLELTNSVFWIDGTIKFTSIDPSKKMIINLNENSKLVISDLAKIDELFANIKINNGELKIFGNNVNINGNISAENNSKISMAGYSNLNLKGENKLTLTDSSIDIKNSNFVLETPAKATINGAINLDSSKLITNGRFDLIGGTGISATNSSHIQIDDNSRLVLHDNTQIALTQQSAIKINPKGSLYLNKNVQILMDSGTFLNIKYQGLAVFDEAKIIASSENGGNISVVDCDVDPNLETTQISPAIYIHSTATEDTEYIKCNKLDLGYNLKVLRGNSAHIGINTQTFVAGK